MQWTSTNAHEKPVEPISDAYLEVLRKEAACISDAPKISGYHLACLLKRLDDAELRIKEETQEDGLEMKALEDK